MKRRAVVVSLCIGGICVLTWLTTGVGDRSPASPQVRWPDTALDAHLTVGSSPDVPVPPPLSVTSSPTTWQCFVVVPPTPGYTPDRRARIAQHYDRVQAQRPMPTDAMLGETDILTEDMTPPEAARYILRYFSTHALTYARRALAADPESYEMRLMVAQLNRRRAPAEAQAHYEELLTMQGASVENRVKALTGMGEVVFRDEPERAFGHLSEAVASAPDDGHARAMLAQTYERLGDADSAIAAYDKASDLIEGGRGQLWKGRADKLRDGRWTFPPLERAQAPDFQ